MRGADGAVVNALADFCASLREERRRRGMRQCDIARPLGVTDTAVAFWELGRLRPLDEHLRAWAGLLDVPVPAGVEGGGRAVAQCGTRSGYGRHLRLREPPCDGCRAANARHQRDRKALR